MPGKKKDRYGFESRKMVKVKCLGPGKAEHFFLSNGPQICGRCRILQKKSSRIRFLKKAKP
jgi:hypothetical protein